MYVTDRKAAVIPVLTCTDGIVRAVGTCPAVKTGHLAPLDVGCFPGASVQGPVLSGVSQFHFFLFLCDSLLGPLDSLVLTSRKVTAFLG